MASHSSTTGRVAGRRSSCSTAGRVTAPTSPRSSSSSTARAVQTWSVRICVDSAVRQASLRGLLRGRAGPEHHRPPGRAPDRPRRLLRVRHRKSARAAGGRPPPGSCRCPGPRPSSSRYRQARPRTTGRRRVLVPELPPARPRDRARRRSPRCRPRLPPALLEPVVRPRIHGVAGATRAPRSAVRADGRLRGVDRVVPVRCCGGQPILGRGASRPADRRSDDGAVAGVRPTVPPGLERPSGGSGSRM